MSEKLSMVLGQQLDLAGRLYHVVRIIERDQTLYENEEGEMKETVQSYAQLMGPNGEVEFISIHSTSRLLPSEEREGKRGLNEKLWRKW